MTTLSTPKITEPLYEGAKVVEVGNLEFSAEVIVISDKYGEIGKGRCSSHFNRVSIPLDQELEFNDRISARQIVGKAQSQTRPQHVVTVQKVDTKLSELVIPDPNDQDKVKLRPPSVIPPLYNCQRIVQVNDVIEGARVEVFDTQHGGRDLIGSAVTPWNNARVRTRRDLAKNDRIQASQKLSLSNLTPSELSTPLKDPVREVTAYELKNISMDKPVIGSKGLGIGSLLVGAKVDIFYEKNNNRISIGGDFAPWSDAIFRVEPIQEEWANKIQVEQVFCPGGPTGSSTSEIVQPEQPEIMEPICPGSFEITVCSKIPTHSSVKIFRIRKGKKEQVGQQGINGYCTTLTLGNGLTLKAGDEVYVVQALGNKESKPVKVEAQSKPEFKIDNGIFCKQCVGEENNPVFVRDKLTKTSGPIFRTAMCGTESATVEILDPNDAPVETITLKELKGKKGYFEGKLDWSKFGKNIPTGKYTAKFTISPSGASTERETKHFYVFKQGCVELEILCAHNKYREEVNVENPAIPPLEPLTWSDNLADAAQKYADHLDTINKLKHSGSIGENLYEGSSSYTVAVNYWASEKKCFKNGVYPDIYNGQCDNEPVSDKNGTMTTCGNLPINDKCWCSNHYAQIVLRKNKQVGCGRANNRIVCRYSPGGYGNEPIY